MKAERGTPEEAPSPSAIVGWGLGDFCEGPTRWGKSAVPVGRRGISAVVCRSPPSGTPSWRDPASQSPPGDGETPGPPRSLAPPPRPVGSSPPPTSLQARHLFRRPGPPRSVTERKTMEAVPARRRVEKPMVNASGSPPSLRERERGEKMNLTAQENYPNSQPGGGLYDGREAEGKP